MRAVLCQLQQATNAVMGTVCAIVVNGFKEEFKQAREVLGHTEHWIGILCRLRDRIYLNSRSINYCFTISPPSLADGIATAMAQLSSHDLDGLQGLMLLFWLSLRIEDGRYDLSFIVFQKGCGIRLDTTAHMCLQHKD